MEIITSTRNLLKSQLLLSYGVVLFYKAIIFFYLTTILNIVSTHYLDRGNLYILLSKFCYPALFFNIMSQMNDQTYYQSQFSIDYLLIFFRCNPTYVNIFNMSIPLFKILRYRKCICHFFRVKDIISKVDLIRSTVWKKRSALQNALENLTSYIVKSISDLIKVASHITWFSDPLATELQLYYYSPAAQNDIGRMFEKSKE